MVMLPWVPSGPRMTVALRQHPREGQATDFPAASLADTQAPHDLGVIGLSSEADEKTWSFQRMVVAASLVSAALWLGIGALVVKALS